MTLIVECPQSYQEERRYIVNVLLDIFLGLDYEIRFSGRHDTRIVARDTGGQLVVPDGLFSTPEDQWLEPASLDAASFVPWSPNANWAREAIVPEAYSRLSLRSEDSPRPVIRESAHHIELGIDVFGTCFFLLTRYEERALLHRDHLDRFPLKHSSLSKHRLLQRPIANEQLELLWAALHRLWPRLERRPRHYSLFLTHDVDSPFASLLGLEASARGAVGDLVRRRSPLVAFQRITSRVAEIVDVRLPDPFDTFDFFMRVAEASSLRAAFYFICDGTYDLEHRRIRELLASIGGRGHEIGLHPGFGTSRSATRISEQLGVLQKSCESLGVTQQHWGGRQHALQWENPATWAAWERAELDYDSSLLFAEEPGFRCGCCYAFPTFHLEERRTLQLVERPLNVMDATLFTYMGLGQSEATEAIMELASVCRSYHGELVLLWHNNKVLTSNERGHYRDVVRAVS